MDLQPIDFALIAHGWRVAGFTMGAPARKHAVGKEAFAEPGLALVEA